MSSVRRGSQVDDASQHPGGAKAGSGSLSALGSIVPDREAFRRDMLSVLPGQFIGHKVSSSSQVDGLSWTGPGTAPPLPLTVPCGLSRPQFLLAGQAASLPFFPSYNQQDGGVVLDRVLLATGRDRWWTTLTGRLKVQQLMGVKKSSTWRQTVGNPEHYALCHNTSITLPSRALLRTKLTYTPRFTSPSLPISKPSKLKLGSWSVSIPDWLQSALQHRRHMAAAASLKRKLKHSEMHAELGLEQEVPGLTGRSLPLHASLDVRTATNQLSCFQYRLGVQHLVTRDGASEEDGFTASTHLRAAAALQGHRTLWSGNPAARREANQRRQHKAAAKQAAGGSAPVSGAAAAAGSSQAGDTSGSTTTTQATTAPRRSKAIGPHNPIRQVLQKMLRGGPAAQAEASSSSSEASKAGQRSDKPVSLLGVTPDQLPQPEAVQEAVIDATQSIKRLREDVQSLADWVSSGNFTQQLEHKFNKQPGSSGGARSAGRPAASHNAEPAPPWSSIVGRPHLRVAGLLGMYAQQPLWPPNGHTTAPDPAEARVAVSGRGDDSQAQEQAEATGAGGAGARASRLLARTNTLSVDLIRAGVAWLTSSYEHSADGVSKVRPFASLGASAQAGWFQQNMLDFTRLAARLDLGCPGQACQADAGVGAGGRWSWVHAPLPYWHALSVSVVQQVAGPVRVCADLRYALDPGSGMVGLSGDAAGYETGGSAGSSSQRPHDLVVSHLRHTMRRVRSTRPHLADAVVGLDVVLPASAGFARLAAWYAPLRKEAMLELRLL